MVGSLPIDLYKKIITKKYNREIGNVIVRGILIYSCQFKTKKETNTQIFRDCLQWSLKCKGTNYFKIMIEGTTGIYYASPLYGHDDYNKSRLFDKNDKTLKLMQMFNNIVNR